MNACAAIVTFSSNTLHQFSYIVDIVHEHEVSKQEMVELLVRNEEPIYNIIVH